MEYPDSHSHKDTVIDVSPEVALIEACEEGRLKDVRALLADHENTVKGFVVDYQFEVPLHTACKAGHLHVVQFLLDHGAHIDRADTEEDMLKHLQHSRKRQSAYSLREVLIKQDLKSKTMKTDMAINYAIRGGHCDIVQFLTERGSCVNAKHYCPSPLRLAASLGHVDIVRHLVAAGSDVNSRDIRGRDALFHATVARSPEIAKILIDAGADVNTCDNNNIYVVAVAARRGYLDMLQLFIDAGCDVNVCVRSEDSPLTAAIESGHIHAVELLLKSGALPDLDPNQGKGSSLWTMLSTNHCRPDILSLILRSGCSVKQSRYGRTPLQFAVEKRWWDAAFMLLGASVDPVREWEQVSLMNRNDLADEAEVLFEALRRMARSPESLLRQSREVIHRNLKVLWPYWERVKQLPLPEYLKEYMLYNV